MRQWNEGMKWQDAVTHNQPRVVQVIIHKHPIKCSMQQTNFRRVKKSSSVLELWLRKEKTIV